VGILYKGRYLRSFDLSRIYFKYIKHTRIEGKITTEELTDLMRNSDFILLDEKKQRYSELPKLTSIKKQEFIDYVFSKLQ
jgi:hypothetical protein